MAPQCSFGRGARHPREVSVPTRSVRLHPGGEGQPRRDPHGTRVRPGAEPRKGAGPRGARTRGRVGSSRDRAGGPARPAARVPGVPDPRLRPGGHVSDPEVRPAGGDRCGGTPRVGVGRLRNPHGRAARDGPAAGGRRLSPSLHGLPALHEHDARRALEADQPASGPRVRHLATGQGASSHAKRDPAAHRGRPAPSRERRHRHSIPDGPPRDPRDPGGEEGDDQVVRHLSGTRPNLPDDQASPPVLSGEGPRAAASRRERVDGDVGPSVSDLRFRPKSDNRLASLLYPCPSSQSRAREATGRQEMTRMKLGVVWLIGFVLGIVFGLLTFIGAGLGAYWILIGGLVIGFLTGFLVKELGKSLGFGFLSAFLGFTVGGIIVVVALAPFLTALPILGGFIGILIVIVAVVFGIGAGILALIGAPTGVLVGKRMAPAAQQPSAFAPPPSM